MAYVIHNVKPKIFLFENVAGLLNSRWTKGGKEKFSKMFCNTFENIPELHGKMQTCSCKRLWRSQNRPRLLIIGLNNKYFDIHQKEGDAVETGFLPKPVYGYPNIEDIFSDLIDENFEYGGQSEKYATSPKNRWQKEFRKFQEKMEAF